MSERKPLYNRTWANYTRAAIDDSLLPDSYHISLHQLELLSAIADEIHTLGDALKQIANSAVYPPLEE